MFALSELKEPIVQAPLAGGPSTPELAAAVCEAGGLGFVAAGYKRAEAVADNLAVVRALTDRSVGVNLFVPSSPPVDHEAIDRYAQSLLPDAERRGATLGQARHDDDDWEAKLALVREEHPAVVSFTFGCPDAEVIDRLHEAGIAVWITITSPAEALQARDRGADALVVQGTEAGGHRGGFSDGDDAAAGIGLLALLRLVSRAAPGLPLIASGGIADGAAVAAVLCAGASAAQIGTALMLAPEAGTAQPHRAALAASGPTRLTRAFTGRSARGIVNRFMREHHADAPPGYPEIHHVTSPLRAAARRAGDADAINLWAGQAHELAEPLPAGEIVRRMGREARAVLAEVSAERCPQPR